eukprot:9090052-Heterocapsa_arctica.AAC.1
MTGNRVRDSIIAKASLYFNDMFEFDLEGGEFINFLSETGEKTMGRSKTNCDIRKYGKRQN